MFSRSVPTLARSNLPRPAAKAAPVAQPKASSASFSSSSSSSSSLSQASASKTNLPRHHGQPQPPHKPTSSATPLPSSTSLPTSRRHSHSAAVMTASSASASAFQPSFFQANSGASALSLLPSPLQMAQESPQSWLKRLARYFGVTAATIFSVFIMEEMKESSTAQACGIVAYIGPDPCVNMLMEGLSILQSRGYDSAGVATVNDRNEFVVTKYASRGSTSDSIALVQHEAPERHNGHKAGIAHTRWATHGGKTDANAHPHLDYKNRVALVHNGTIENSDKLREELEQKGIKFRSETDTEVIVQLIGAYLDQGLDFPEAVKKAISRLEGTWGLVILHKDHPNQIIAARNGSPLVVGLGKDFKFVASEISAFSRHAHEYVDLKDGELAIIESTRNTLDLSRVEKTPQEKIELSPAPYPHWTIKEILEQPEAINRVLGAGGRFEANGQEVKLGGLNSQKEILLGIRHLVISACGTSYFASIYGSLVMRSLGSFETVQPIDASELQSDTLVPKNGGLLAVSQSGETKDVHRTLELAQQMGQPIFSVVNAVGSLIARTTRCGVYLNAGRENAVASTKAFTTQVTAMCMIASWFSQNRNVGPQYAQKRQELMEAIHRLSTSITIALKTIDQCREISKKLVNKEHLFILGKGYGYPIALEGALKIKEITYLHAEGYGGGALKHGPFALLNHGIPVIMLILDDQHAELMRIVASQVKARGTYNIVITDKPELAKGLADDIIPIPANGPLTALVGVIPLQLIAYELSILKGIDPDKPRHLAKAITVD